MVASNRAHDVSAVVVPKLVADTNATMVMNAGEFRSADMDTHDEITALLKSFQDGYVARDLAKIDAFMDLFTPDAQVIGTGGTLPGKREW